MYDNLSGSGKFDIVREIIWSLLLTVASFIYWVALLLAITFVFNSVLMLTFENILLISAILSAAMLLYRIIKGGTKRTGG